MERAGIRIDTAALADYAQQLAAQRADIEQQIFTLAGHPFNINSPRQLGQVLYDEMHITDRPPLTATKQYSTSEDILQRYPIVVYPREGSEVTGFEFQVPKIKIVKTPLINISSTQIRQRIQAGKSVRGLVPTGVAMVLEQEHLYR